MDYYHGQAHAALPPVFAASALYDNLLQAALRQFFGRATFETEPIPSLSSDGRLAIEPTDDPSVLSIRWFGSRHVLHVPPRRPFTAHEVRLAKAIGAVLAVRYRAIFDPRQMLEREDLFRGAIEDRYVGAFLDSTAYAEPSQNRADLIANAIEVLRVAALSSYENHSISSGVLLLDSDHDRAARDALPRTARYIYTQALTGIKSFYRLCDGLQHGVPRQPRRVVLDVVEVAQRIARRHAGRSVSDAATGRTPWPPPDTRHLHRAEPVARDQSVRRRRAAVQLPQRALAPARRRGEVQHVGDVGRQRAARRAPLPDRHRPRRRARRRAVRRAPGSGSVVAPARGARRSTRLDRADGKPGRARRAGSSCTRCAAETATGLDPAVLAGLAKVDGATVLDQSGRLLAVGAILLHPEPPEPHSSLAVEGARTTAAMAAGRFGAVLKVSEDGLITFYDQQERIWDI